MRSYDEIANNVLSRRDEYVKNKKLKRKRAVTILSTSLSFVVILVVIQAVWLNNNLYDGGDVNPSPNPQVNTTENDSSESDKYYSEPKAQGDLPDYDKPYSTDITIEGEEIPDEEAESYINESTSEIKSLLNMTGTPTFLGGYCHITYDDGAFKLRQGYRDYLIYDDDELVGIVTIYKENGELYNTLSCGAKWFKDYDAYLKSHKGEKLLYLYVGMQEVIISPDGELYNPLGYDVSVYSIPYDTLYNDKAVYIP